MNATQKSDHGSPLLIVGASARAAAASAVRCGFQPFSVDQFADVDLRQIATVRELAGEFPAGISAVCETIPAMPWLYVGGLENYPAIVEQIAARRPLLGNGDEVLRRVRDPWELSSVCSQCEVPLPEMRRELTKSDDLRDWLWKGTDSSAGLQVCAATQRLKMQAGYFQRRQSGTPLSAAFVSNRVQSVMLGVTQQLIGREFQAPRAYQYAGNIAPLAVSAACEQRLRTLGEALTAEFRLQGVWGFDFLLDGDDLWGLEVNPRYCSSFELLERAYQLPMIALHVGACSGAKLPMEPLERRTPGLCGKLIVYAPNAGEFPPGIAEELTTANAGRDWPRFADISPDGTQFSAGGPLVTVFAEGESVSEVQIALKKARVDFLRRLIPSAE